MQECRLCFLCSYYLPLIDIVNCCNCCIFLLHFCSRKVALQLFEIFEYYLVPLYNRSIWSATCKNDNHTDIHFLIMSPDPYFYFISGLYLSNHLKYFNKTLRGYTPCQCKVSHLRVQTLLFFIFKLSPLINVLIAAAVEKTWFSWTSQISCFHLFGYASVWC